MPFRQFIYSLGSRSSAPGGGSASAAIGAMVSLVKELRLGIDQVHITEESLSLLFRQEIDGLHGKALSSHVWQCPLQNLCTGQSQFMVFT